MKKVIISIVVLVGIAGLVALMSYKPTSSATNAGLTAPGSSAGQSVASPATSTGTPPVYKDGTYTGSTADVGYVPVQVQAVISGGKITAINYLQMPSDASRSQMIASQAKPMLMQEAISAQSANVDTISGATADSGGFVQSLTSALSQAI